MAGIGIQLNKTLAKSDYSSILRAYVTAGVIACGPWLIMVLSLAVLGLAIRHSSSHADLNVFAAAVSLVYGSTLILTGPLQLVLARFAADQQFANRSDRIFPSFARLFAWVAAGFALAGLIVFVGFVPGSLLFRLSTAMLTVAVATIWISSVLLTSLKRYLSVLLCFAGGCLVSLFASSAGAARSGLGGAMFGFAFGHLLLSLLLYAAIFREIGHLSTGGRDLWAAFSKYWELAVAGLCYAAGIWVDKFLCWWAHPEAQRISGLLSCAPIYDRAVFFALLSIVPGMAVFLLKVETDFALKCRAFFGSITDKCTLSEVVQRKSELAQSLRHNFTSLVRLQGTVTAGLLIGSTGVSEALHLTALQLGVFQIALVGSFLLVLFMALLTILLYLDKRRDAMVSCLLFALVNTGVTTLSFSASERGYGLGFLAGAGVGLALSAVLVNRHIRELEYEVFALQPIEGSAAD
jgi:uncharacterized membrane protein